MITALNAAKYIASTYRRMYNEDITEMKLHKLLYFAQRESLINTDVGLFPETFEGWRFGPVIPSIRRAFSDIKKSSVDYIDDYSRSILDETMRRYGGKDPWSLSRLSHGEYSWKNSRKGISEYQNSNNEISIDDIRVDAKRVKERRQMLSDLGF